jgi:hypothetical protein
MPRNIHPDTLAALGQKVVRLAFLVRIEFPAPNRLVFTTLLDNYDFDGDTFIGLGNLGSVSMPSSDGDLSPSQYAVTLSGINDDILEAATRLDYLNHLATSWAMTLDEDHQVIGQPFVWWRGLTDGSSINYGKISSVTVQVRDRLTDWARPRIERYTDEDQQRKHPGDRGFQFVSQISTREVEWPAESWFRKNA